MLIMIKLYIKKFRTHLFKKKENFIALKIEDIINHIDELESDLKDINIALSNTDDTMFKYQLTIKQQCLKDRIELFNELVPFY